MLLIFLWVVQNVQTFGHFTERKMAMIAVKKETLEDSLTRILWYYLNNDFTLNVLMRELYDPENIISLMQSAHSMDSVLKSNAFLLKNYIAMNFLTGVVNPLFADMCQIMIDAIDLEAIGKKFFEESLQ